jgi:hypothetical protein
MTSIIISKSIRHLLYDHAMQCCPDIVSSSEAVYTNSESFFFNKKGLIEYFENDTYISKELGKIVSDNISDTDVLRFFENAQDKYSMGKFQIYLPWLLALNICKISKGSHLVIPTKEYASQISIRDATPVMYYFEQRVIDDPLFVNVLTELNYSREYRRQIDKDTYYKMDACYEFKFTTTNGIECNNRLFLEIQEDRFNHTNQQSDSDKDMVVRSEGDDIIYYRINNQYPEYKDKHTSHIWYYENHLRPKLIAGLLQSSKQFQIDYCMHQFRLSVQNEIEHLVSDEQQEYKLSLESQLNDETRLFKELMKYCKDQILGATDKGFVKATVCCVPILNLVKIVSFGDLEPSFVEFAKTIYRRLDHKVTEDGTILLSFRNSVAFLIECSDFVEKSHFRYINLYLGSIQPIYTEMIEIILNDSRLRAHNILKYKDRAHAVLDQRHHKKSIARTEKIQSKYDGEVLGNKTAMKEMKQRMARLEGLLRRNNIEFNEVNYKKNKYESVRVLRMDSIQPGEPIVSGIPNFPIVRRRDSHPRLEFITDIETNKILENYVSQSVARELMKDIREQYIEDIPHRLNEVYLLDPFSYSDTDNDDEIVESIDTDAKYVETDSDEMEPDETESDSECDDAVRYFLNKKR